MLTEVEIVRRGAVAYSFELAIGMPQRDLIAVCASYASGYFAFEFAQLANGIGREILSATFECGLAGKRNQLLISNFFQLFSFISKSISFFQSP